MILIMRYWMITVFMHHDIYLFLQGTMVHVQKTFSNNNCESFSLINSLYQPAQMISRCGLHVCARRAQPDLNSKKPAHWWTTTFHKPKCSCGTFSRKYIGIIVFLRNAVFLKAPRNYNDIEITSLKGINSPSTASLNHPYVNPRLSFGVWNTKIRYFVLMKANGV